MFRLVFSAAFAVLIAIGGIAPSFAQALSEAELRPYEILRRAYAQRDARLAGEAYTETARFELQDEKPARIVQTRAAIENWYLNLFVRVEDDEVLDLNFRIESRMQTAAGIEERGAYRLRVGPRKFGFGRFTVVRDPKTGLFASDVTGSGTREDFERIPGPVMFKADAEDLDPAFYGRLTGRYRFKDGCVLVVTHSVVRVLVRNTCDQSWRGLDRVSGAMFRAGTGVVPVDTTLDVAFDLPRGDAPAASMTLGVGASAKTALRDDVYGTGGVVIGADGAWLDGTLWWPKGRKAKAYTVLVHGSGPQDRNGYASIIAVLADELAASGHAVLTYDKRGSGRSTGDGDGASFKQLAADAEAARRFGRSMPNLKDLPAGFAGSSQAGWVIAAAIRDGSTPSHVVLLGAAGAALSVEEQNLYNTETLMRCAGLGADRIDAALAQQRAFFDYLGGRGSADALDAATARASAMPGLGDWLFPASRDARSDPRAWYNVLELAFDPIPVWSRYSGAMTIIQGGNDDSTPSKRVRERWTALNKDRSPKARLVELSSASHLGLVAESACDTDFRRPRRFDPKLFEALRSAGANP